jgi:ZIP family zinc transporter
VHAEPGVLVLEFIEGHTFTPDDVKNSKNLSRLVDLIHRTHRDIPKYLRGPGVLFWVFHVVRDYAHSLSEASSPNLRQIRKLVAQSEELEQAVGPIEGALTAGRDGRFLWLSFLLLAGFTVGLMSLVYYDLWMKRRRRKAFLGPGAASTAEFEEEHHFTGMSPARWLAVFIATGIGLHNFSEGLAIGQSAAANEVSLAIVLIIGFGLHNATEGLGICAPLTGDREQPSWGFLALLGLIGGGPTFIGTIVGQAWVNESVSIIFFALAAGSILYVVMELLNVGRALAPKQVVTWGVLIGLFLGFATDFILVAAGA